MLREEFVMRKLVIMFVVGLAALALAPQGAVAVKLTQQQVQTVCNGKSACAKDCGLNGEHQCIFACNKTGCSGTCPTCGVKTRMVFPNRYGNRVVRAEMVMPVSTYRAHRPTYCEWCYASCPPGWGGRLCRVHCQSRGGCQRPVVRHP